MGDFPDYSVAACLRKGKYAHFAYFCLKCDNIPETFALPGLQHYPKVCIGILCEYALNC